MRRATNRRRFLYLLGATSAVGFAGYGAADEHSDDHGHGQDHDEHERDHDAGHHEGDEAYEDEFNHADIEFMQMMIHHHEQAIEMAKLIPGRTDRQELCELGPEIIEVQQAEIELMHDWLDEAGADARDHELDHHDMEGMMSPEEMQHLREIDGQEFDCLFVEHMIHHHDGAIIMAEDVLGDGQADRVAELAEDVIDVQETEIEMMEGWQRDWEC